MIADGLSNREIGARLYLAEKTVKTYIAQGWKVTDPQALGDIGPATRP